MYQYLLLLLMFTIVHADEPEKAEGNTTSAPGNDFVTQNMGSNKILYTNNQNPIIELPYFDLCETPDCNKVCGTREPLKSFCDPKNAKLCMCNSEKFMTTNIEGRLRSVDSANSREKKCLMACHARNSYPRIWSRSDDSENCICLINQITLTGITLCDEFALYDACKDVCRSDSAVCAFNGVCLCRDTWKDVFANNLKNIRLEDKTDENECSKRCQEYKSEFVGRIYDEKPEVENRFENYDFRNKYCLCGEELEREDTSMQEKLFSQGFQECTDLKCKKRCGLQMDAKCEPKYRRACLCRRSNVYIGNWLWARLPTRKETLCTEVCVKNGFHPRVIEWNPFYEPKRDNSLTVYRTSEFPYMYDGKFCHCMKLTGEPDLNQFRPCTDELCAWLCGHYAATCDMKTRRVCICQTHQMLAGLGRRPDPGETNCNIICRRNLLDARILDLIWKIKPPHWTVAKGKFCACIRPVSPAGLSHCEGIEGRDVCPRLCNNTEAYCTQDKVCECFNQPNLLDDPLIRQPDGKETIECGEICTSWTWPIAQDLDHVPYIYDETRLKCLEDNSCPEVDTTPWTLSQPGALAVSIDALEQASSESFRKYCLCVKQEDTADQPGLRVPFKFEPLRLSKQLPCIQDYICEVRQVALYVVGTKGNTSMTV